ncbi:PAS domain-containing protein [Metapseudomonas lalkuanensis]|uniref:PAS domain-containing protein n=1 Tax=Metapseudomonas lalkuanensis TaxID=2604832 RepID=A0A5J6QGT7_9GAMM|nr:methyl-accepting chemotaxis protein [Pseudomonas lalkuanensis]QEY61750.1 PAS domain-containing protein [Pseudomonas lalkuanensis]
MSLTDFTEPPISRLDPEGRVLACNDAYLDLCGYSREELLGKGYDLINHPGMPPLVLDGMWRTLRAGVPWNGPLMGRHREGGTFWSDLYVVPLFEGGQLVALGTVYHPMDRATCLRADALYARLRQGKPAEPAATRALRLLGEHSVAALGGLLLVGATLAGELDGRLGLALLVGTGAISLQAAHVRQRGVIRGLASHPQVYSDPLLAPAYSQRGGADALLDMAMGSLQLRLRTVMARIHINGDILRSRAGESSELVASEAGQLERQLEETEQSAAAIQQMSSTIHELSRNLQHSAQATQAVDELARDGDRLAGQSQASMQTLHGSVEDIGMAVGQLAESIESISGIAEVIQSIAEQTNLLALNAAIEAARAGESGRGFAVVADEVRTLASRTRDSTGQIQQSIERLRNGSAQALATAQRGEQAAQQSTTDVEQVRESLRRISGEVGQISGMSLQMATAIEQQGQVAEEISRQIARIAGLAEQSAGQAQRSTQIGQELHQLARSQLDLAQRFLHG